jgi:hypothetical protein
MLTPFAAAVCLLALLFLSTNPLRFSRIEAKCQRTDLDTLLFFKFMVAVQTHI